MCIYHGNQIANWLYLYIICMLCIMNYVRVCGSVSVCLCVFVCYHKCMLFYVIVYFCVQCSCISSHWRLCLVGAKRLHRQTDLHIYIIHHQLPSAALCAWPFSTLGTLPDASLCHKLKNTGACDGSWKDSSQTCIQATLACIQTALQELFKPAYSNCDSAFFILQ